MGALKEVRARGYGQDRDIKVWIEKSGFLNNKRKVYSTFWGSNTKKYEENKKLYDWDPIEFNPSDLDEASGFGEYKKYYDDWIRERDQPNTGFKAYNNFQRNGLEFSADYNTDLDIIKLYILINTEKYKETVYEWSLIQDPIVGAKGGDAPYYRNFGFDAYYLNNGAKIRIAWLEGSYTKGSVSWSNEKGRELLDQDLTRYNTNYLSKESKAGYSKAMDGIWAPEGNPAGDKFMDYNHNGSAPKFSKEAIYGKDRMKWGGLTDDETILYNIVAAWKEAVPDYNDLAVLKNIYGNPAIDISDSKDKLIPYKSPFGDPKASGPTASDAAQGASASDSAAAKGATQSKFKPTIEGIADGFQIQAKVDLPSFTVYVGDPKKDWPAAGVASEENPPEEEFDNVDGAPVEGEDEYSETAFKGSDEEQIKLDLTTFLSQGDSEGGADDDTAGGGGGDVQTGGGVNTNKSQSAGGAGDRRFQKQMTINGRVVKNGELPDDLLAKLDFCSFKVEKNAARRLNELNVAYKAQFGKNIALSGGFRTFKTQNDIFDWDYYDKYKKARKKGTNGGVAAATPGTSLHGWGQAIDCSGFGNGPGNKYFDWMEANAKKYGWVNPAWAKKSGAGYEPWHWEYIGSDLFK